MPTRGVPQINKCGATSAGFSGTRLRGLPSRYEYVMHGSRHGEAGPTNGAELWVLQLTAVSSKRSGF